MPRIETGHSVTNDVSVVDGNNVRFVTDDGRTMFEVRWEKDGRSIEVRAVECCRVGDVLYAGLLDLRMRYANSVKVMVRDYEDQL